MKKWIIYFWLLSLLVCIEARAALLSNLYQVSIPVPSTSRADFQKVLPQALVEVLLKVSGDTQVVHNNQVQAQINQASSLVQSYSYSQNDQNQNILQISFSKEGIDQLLRSAKIAILPENRPLTLLWIVTQSKDNAAVLHDANNSLVAKIQSIADLRGIPILWPAMDLQDVTALPIDKINSFDVNAISTASKRYQSNMILAGNLTQAADGQWQGRWLLIKNDTNTQWQTQTSDPSQAISSIFNHIIAASILPGMNTAINSSTAIVTLKINGVNGLDDYSEVIKYLRSLSIVSDVSAKQVNPDSLILELKVLGGQPALTQALNQGRKLTPEPQVINNNTAADTANVLFYHWQSSTSQPTLSLQPMPTAAPQPVSTSAQGQQTVDDTVVTYPGDNLNSGNGADLNNSATDGVSP